MTAAGDRRAQGRLGRARGRGGIARRARTLPGPRSSGSLQRPAARCGASRLRASAVPGPAAPARRRIRRPAARSPRTCAESAHAAGGVQEKTPSRAAPRREMSRRVRKSSHVTRS